MCLIAFSFDPSHPQPIMLAANRDEFFSRPTHPPAWWDDHTGVFGGRDAQAGGTWMAVLLPAYEADTPTRTCRFAALTNVRGSVSPLASPPSRGHLVTRLFDLTSSLEALLNGIAAQGSSYAGFNLLAFEWQETTNRSDTPSATVTGLHGWHLSNSGPQQQTVLAVEPGVHGLSNGAFDEAWPKTKLLTDAMNEAIRATEQAEADQRLLSALTNARAADDSCLPDTGIGSAAERELSMPFIRARFDSFKNLASYGTRTSTLFNLRASGQCRFRQITWDSGRQEPTINAIREMQSGGKSDSGLAW